MVNRLSRFLICLGICVTLTACGGDTAPTETATDFATPISNQTERHEETEHVEAEAGHDEAGHDEAGHDEAGHDEAGHDHSHLDPALATAEMGVALVPSELVVGANRFAVGL